jgi:hypothetical protein
MMDGVKICCPLRADRHFTKHGVIFEAPSGIFCNSLVRGPQCFLSTIANRGYEKDGFDPEIWLNGVMKVYNNKAAHRI